MMLPVYHKLFNTILSLGTVPNIWGNGNITPIFKSGAKKPVELLGHLCFKLSGKAILFNFKQKTTWARRFAERTS